MGAARLALGRMPDARFWKLCGSGTGEGFTPVPNTEVWAILAVWDDEQAARRNVGDSSIFRRWTAKADEAWTVFLGPTSARGKWSGKSPFAAVWDSEPVDGMPLAVLTRATIKAGAASLFWKQEPEISKAIGADPNVIFKIGIGEIPLIHQVTFSIWPDTQSMATFARKDGPHARAIRAVREGGWFKEELYARFRVLGSMGSWEGRNPILSTERQAA